MTSPYEPITLNPSGDASVVVTELSTIKNERVQFRVSRRVIDALNLSSDKPEIRLSNNDAASLKTVELLLRCMELNGSDEPLPDEFYVVPIQEVWRVLTLVDIKALKHFRPGTYKVPCSVLMMWFEAWFKRRWPGFTESDEYEQLLYPTFAFGIPAAFTAVTKWLAYDVVGQIREQNPLREVDDLPFQPYRDMHMPKDVIRVLRGAKAALRDTLIRLLDESEQRFIHGKCPCRIQGLANFTRALSADNSLSDLLDRNPLRTILHFLSTSFKYEPPTGSENCASCGPVVGLHVEGDAREISIAFHGLCLTCMDRSVNNRGVYENLSEMCEWHGKMTWKHSDLRLPQPQKSLVPRPSSNERDDWSNW
ncbi:hypothetical protein F5Y10DRAFT_288460 [Nemania abortiva]|nr:hypothetical protein F5Y10DRAFT_288460 [Nemania abortiva]